MHTFLKTTITAFALLAAVITINSSCNKQFDQPPVFVAPKVTANTTIKDLKAIHATSGRLDLVTQDLIIRGIVVADDKSGNFFKTIVIQDATGGITLLLGGNNLFNSYPIGREIFVNCKGLYLGDYNRVIQLGGGIDASGTTPSLADIPSSLFTKYIVKGSFGNIVTPRVVTAAALGTNMQDTLINTLIQLNNFEFSVSDTDNTYALPNQNPPGTANFTIRDCSGGSITLRNSGYSAFAGFNVPNGNGSIVSLYTVFGSTKQLTIRDTADLKMYGARCSAGGGGGGVTPPPVGALLSENFDTQVVPSTAPFNSISLAGWINLDEAGGRKYESRVFSSNKYAQLGAFGSNQANVTTWLVTRGIDLGSNTTKTLSFGTSGGFNNGATLKVFVSSNFTGAGNPWAAGVSWTDITASATLCPIPATGFFTGFTPSGNISLNSYSGTIYVAFKYEGADPAGTANDKTTTWQIDNILVTGN